MRLDGNDAATLGIACAPPEAIALGVPPLADTQYHGGTAFGASWGWPSIYHRSFALVTAAGDPFQRDAYLFTDSDDPLRFGIGIAVELSVVRAQNQDAHLVVVHLAEFVEVQAGDNAHLLIEVALGMEIFAKAGADIGELLEPADLFRLEFALAIDDPHIDLEPVLVGQQLLDPVIEFEKGADQD